MNPALPEGLVKPVVGVAGDQAQADFALAADEAGAQVLALLADRIRQSAVFAVALLPENLAFVNPGMALLHPAGAFGGDDESG